MLGETQSGKTTLIDILETALNKAMNNELGLRIAELRKQRLKEVAINYLEEKRQEEENPKNKKKSKKRGDNDMLGLEEDNAGGPAREKKKSKKNAAKSRNQLWIELYKKSKLSKGDIEELKVELV